MVAWQMSSGVGYNSWQCYVIQISVVGACHVDVGSLIRAASGHSATKPRHRVCEQLPRISIRRDRVELHKCNGCSRLRALTTAIVGDAHCYK